MAKGNKKDPEGQTTICRNRRATHDYAVTDTIECGMVLVGTEVKSLRDGHASLDDAYARIDDGEVWLIGAEIPEYLFGNRLNHKPKRPRKLLLHRREIEQLARKVAERGLTLVPLRLHFKGHLVKVDLGLARGKRAYDKRQTVAKRDAEREMARARKARTRA